MAVEGLWRRALAVVRPRWAGVVRWWPPLVGSDIVIAAQAGLAAGAAWLVASKVLHSPEPVFAPTIAVGAVVSSQGRRLRRSGQLVGGVVVGVAVGELFVISVGTGYWQVGVSVVLAVGLAVAVKGGTALMFQAGSTAVLIATLSPTARVEFPRFFNSLIGAVVGLVVVALFLPLDPLRAVRRAISPPLGYLADRLRGSARALQARDADAAQEELDQLQDMSPLLARANEAVERAREAVTLAPIHWRHRHAFEQYAEGVEHMERMVLNCHPMLRRTVTLIRDEEPVPDALVAAVRGLGEAVRTLDREFGPAHPPRKTRKVTLAALGRAGRAYGDGVGFSGGVLVAQVRTAATDLLRATGVGGEQAIGLVRQAAGEPAGFTSGSPR